MLGRKHRIDQGSWARTLENIESMVPRRDLESLVEKAVAGIRERTRGKNAAYGWSGGKDSLVLQSLCNMAGIRECVLAITDLEYPEFLTWVKAHGPGNMETVNTGQDMGWLAANPEMLFPHTSRVLAKWYRVVQHRAQGKFCKDRRCEVLVLGRRLADGNQIVKRTDRYSPLATWTHEDVLAFIHYHRLVLPPIYNWKNGFRCGTHPWPARPYTGSVQNGWREIFEIDKTVVFAAAKSIASAKQFLGGKSDA